jgi:probable rRNA maturation factor
VRFAKKAGVTAAWVRRVVARTLKLERAPGAVGVLVTGDAEIRRINKRHLGHDYATDVISFGLGEKGTAGDLVVSADTARSTAKELGLPYREELARYLVHGTLHLLGYDDVTPAKKKVMFRRQEAHLKKILKGS